MALLGAGAGTGAWHVALEQGSFALKMGYGLRGYLDELKFFAEEITDDEALRATMWERTSAGVTAYYRFNDNSLVSFSNPIDS
jgi:hypothetical protein